MADVVYQIIGELPANLTPEQTEAILTVCSVSIPVFAVLFIDFVRDIFSGLCRG